MRSASNDTELYFEQHGSSEFRFATTPLPPVRVLLHHYPGECRHGAEGEAPPHTPCAT